MIVRLRTDEIKFLEERLEYWLKAEKTWIKIYENPSVPFQEGGSKEIQESIDNIENILVALAEAVMEI